MTGPLESPQLALIIGGLAVAILIAGFLKTAQARWLIAALVAGLLAVGLVVAERMVVTEGEVIEQIIGTLANAIERDDATTVLSAISPSAPQVQAEAKVALKAYRLREANVKRNLKVALEPPENPTKATATFNAVLVGGDRGGITDQQRAALFFTLEFAKEQGAWRVTSYRYEDPREGVRE